MGGGQWTTTSWGGFASDVGGACRPVDPDAHSGREKSDGTKASLRATVRNERTFAASRTLCRFGPTSRRSVSERRPRAPGTRGRSRRDATLPGRPTKPARSPSFGAGSFAVRLKSDSSPGRWWVPPIGLGWLSPAAVARTHAQAGGCVASSTRPWSCGACIYARRTLRCRPRPPTGIGRSGRRTCRASRRTAGPTAHWLQRRLRPDRPPRRTHASRELPTRPRAELDRVRAARPAWPPAGRIRLVRGRRRSNRSSGGRSARVEASGRGSRHTSELVSPPFSHGPR